MLPQLLRWFSFFGLPVPLRREPSARTGWRASAARAQSVNSRQPRFPPDSPDYSACKRDRLSLRRPTHRNAECLPQAYAFFSKCPPNSYRMADSSLSAKSLWPRELKRINKAPLITGAGIPSSIAAWSVQRPSPESDTCPPKDDNSGSRANAVAIRSRSQEPMTLPRHHTSATSEILTSYW